MRLAFGENARAGTGAGRFCPSLSELRGIFGNLAWKPYTFGMAEEISPCPFCGETKHLAAEADPHQGEKWGSVRCGACGCVGPEVRTGYRAVAEWEDSAIVEWNRRV